MQTEVSRTWIAVAFAALDVAHISSLEADIVLLPIYPIDEPLGLSGMPAELWKRLVFGPVSLDELTPDERTLIGEFEEVGIASRDLKSLHRITQIAKPWFESFIHELVNALLVSLSKEEKIDMFTFKGPIVWEQGLRQRRDSGDVDVWGLFTKESG